MYFKGLRRCQKGKMPLRQVHEIEEVIPIRTLRPLPKQPDVRSRRLPSRSGIGSARTAVQSLCDWRRTNSLRPSIVSLAGSLPLHRRWHSGRSSAQIRTLRPLPMQRVLQSRRLPSRSGIGSARTAVQSLCDWRRTNSLRPSIVSLAGFPSAAPEMAQRKEFSSNQNFASSSQATRRTKPPSAISQRKGNAAMVILLPVTSSMSPPAFSTVQTPCCM